MILIQRTIAALRGRAEAPGASAARAARIDLPADGRRPLVLIAGGAGLGPVIALLRERLMSGATGTNLLLIGARNRRDLYHEPELIHMVENRQADVFIALSRDAQHAVTLDGGLIFRRGEPLRLPTLMRKGSLARRLHALLIGAELGKEGACFRVCGKSDFSQSILTCLEAILERHDDGPAACRARRAAEHIHRMRVHERLVVKDSAPVESEDPELSEGTALFDASEVARHNNPVEGYWITLRRQVYDVTRIRQGHSAQDWILESTAGLDATGIFERMGDHLRADIRAMLDRYRIGAIRRLDFGGQWGFAPLAEGARLITLQECFSTWARFLHHVVEIENVLTNELSARGPLPGPREEPEPRTPREIRRRLSTHGWLHEQVLPGLLGSELRALGHLTHGLFAPAEPIESVGRLLVVPDVDPTLGAMSAARIRAQETLAALTDGKGSDESHDSLLTLCRHLEKEDRRLVADLKTCVAAGLSVFERLGHRTLEIGAPPILQTLREIPELVRAAHRRLAGAP